MSAADYILVRRISEPTPRSDVFLCVCEADSKEYAMKRLVVPDAEVRRRAEAEVKNMCSLQSHPNIVAYKDCFSDAEDRFCIVMEFCDGGNLAKKIKELENRQFNEDQLLNWTLDICLALQFIHSRNIVHRDLKPQNIFLTAGGTVKIGDFGLSRELRPGSYASSCAGTPLYISPEMAAEEKYDQKTDVWSLGCSLFEMMTFKPAIDQLTFTMHGMRDLAPMPPGGSVKLKGLVQKMLTREVANRPTVADILFTDTLMSQLALRPVAYEFWTPVSGIHVSVIPGDIIKQTVDALVSPVDTKLSNGGGASKTIAEAAGDDLKQACRDHLKNNGDLKITDVIHTKAGRLQPAVSHVMHAAGPAAKQFPDQAKLREALCSTFHNCLTYANDTLKIVSIAVPAISSGTFAVPISTDAEEAYNALMKFDQRFSTSGTSAANNTNNCSLKTVRFVCIRQDITMAFTLAFMAGLKH